MSKCFVIVRDNFHYMDESEWTPSPGYEFDSFENAINYCKKIVNESLEECFKPNVSAEELFSMYTMFGDDPFAYAPNQQEQPEFSAWDYARIRCQELSNVGGRT